MAGGVGTVRRRGWERQGRGLSFSQGVRLWAFAQKVLPAPGSTASWFGQRLSLSGEWLAASDLAGDVSLYRRGGNGTWLFFQKISNFAADYHAFHLKGTELLCGSASFSAGNISSGRGELYAFNLGSATWQRQAEFRGSQPEAYGLIGGAVRINEQGYFLGSGYRATSISGATIPPGTCHFFAHPALDSYAAWAQRTFSPAELGGPQSGPNAVVNSLGITNRLGYAMGLDPHAPDPRALPRLEFDPLDQRLGYRFQMRPNASDFSWRVVSSQNLQNWSTFNGSPNLIGYGPGVQLHFRKLPLSATAPQFIRIEVMPLSE